MTNGVGLQTASTIQVGQDSIAHVARRCRFQTDDGVETETGFRVRVAFFISNRFERFRLNFLKDISCYEFCLKKKALFSNCTLMIIYKVRNLIWKVRNVDRTDYFWCTFEKYFENLQKRDFTTVHTIVYRCRKLCTLRAVFVREHVVRKRS